MSDVLAGEFQHYLAHQDDLVAQYDGKIIVIKGNKVLGVYDSDIEAVNETTKNHELGTFLVQAVSAGTGAYTQKFHSRTMRL